MFCPAFFITKLSTNSSRFVWLSLSLLMYRMLSVNYLSWNIAALLFIFNSLESWKGPFAWATSDLQAKKQGFVWLHKLKTTNLRHQTQTRFCHFFAVSVSRWGRVLRLPVGKVDFACYSISSRSSLICLAWEQYKLQQVLNSNLISGWLTEENSNGTKSHLKLPIELYATQTLTKLQYCSVN